MSIYETSITNPKKQLEFYKQLSEQLQQENKQQKIQISAREEVCNRLESNWNKLREIIRKKLNNIKLTSTEEIFDNFLVSPSFIVKNLLVNKCRKGEKV